MDEFDIYNDDFLSELNFESDPDFSFKGDLKQHVTETLSHLQSRNRSREIARHLYKGEGFYQVAVLHTMAGRVHDAKVTPVKIPYKYTQQMAKPDDVQNYIDYRATHITQAVLAKAVTDWPVTPLIIQFGVPVIKENAAQLRPSEQFDTNRINIVKLSLDNEIGMETDRSTIEEKLIPQIDGFILNEDEIKKNLKDVSVKFLTACLAYERDFQKALDDVGYRPV